MKGIWAIIFSIPVFIVVLLVRNVQVVITYTGGVCGTFMLLIFPTILVQHARKRKIEETYGHNFNRSPFQSPAFYVLIYSIASLTILAVIIGPIVTGTTGSH